MTIGWPEALGIRLRRDRIGLSDFNPVMAWCHSTGDVKKGYLGRLHNFLPFEQGYLSI